MDLSKLLQELDFDSIKKENWYVDELRSFQSINAPLARIFHDPQSAGIDIEGKGAFYLDVGSNKSEVYSSIVLPLSDVTSFESMLSNDNRIRWTEDNGLRYSQISAETSCAWSDTYISFITSSPDYDRKKALTKAFRTGVSWSEKELFQDQVWKSPEAISFWVDLNSYARNQILARNKASFLATRFLKNNLVYGDIHLKPGKATVKANYKSNALVKKLLGSVLSDDFDPEVYNYLLPEPPSFLVNTSFNLQGVLNYLLDEKELRLEARNSLLEYGMNMEDINDAFSGDILYASYPTDNPDKTAALVGIRINDKTIFEQLLKVWTDLGKLIPEGDGQYKSSMGNIPFFPLQTSFDDKKSRILVKGNYMFSSGSKKIIDHIRIGTTQPDNIASSMISGKGLLSVYSNSRFDLVRKQLSNYPIENFTIDLATDKIVLDINLKDKNSSALKTYLFNNRNQNQ